ncbi:hypothetical protein [Brasilonema bromeliae]|uniref:Polymerase nucleotidyl transferase domain-containing protein n=1 Tax=Brasilonema bromeliae SPC951 TaxID=385972 RepID=A0ABX1P727_9CYAN|nr:hypothetical protein [Brasilonema bromeliae]NMG20151.1 hypothetical protein [Brasilonema bromeliae SPC951]
MVSKSKTKAESQKSKARTAANSKKTVIEPKIQEANNAKSTAPRARSKQTDEPALKTQATKKVKSPNGKANSTTGKATKQANSKTKVQPTKKAKVAAGKSSSTTNKRTQKVVSQIDIKPTEQPTFSTAKASPTGAKSVSQTKVQPIPKAKTSTAKTRHKNKKNSFENNFFSEPEVDRKSGRKANLDLKASTVQAAFKKFQSKIVDLERSTTEKGRTSRDYLFKQVKRLVKNHSDFPPLKGNYIPFGSFARKTKIRPLDDIDILLLLNGRGINVEISYQQKPSGYGVNMTAVCRVKITDARSPLQAFADDKGYVNSIKILNRIKHHHRRQ